MKAKTCKKPKAEKLGLCPTCKKNPAMEDHECPYADEINDDHRKCNCCADCQHECAMDI